MRPISRGEARVKGFLAPMVQEKKLSKKAMRMLARRLCHWCGNRAWGGRLGSWLINDDLWKAAGYLPTDVACLSCLTRRLRRVFNIKERGFDAAFAAADRILHPERFTKAALKRVEKMFS